MTEIDYYINEKILNAWGKGKRYTIGYSGRGTGKTMAFAALCIIYAVQNPGSRILAIRGSQNKISESSLQVMKDVISAMKLDEYFEITEHTLSCKNGSEFLFYGGARNYYSIKSLQNISLCFIDEATELPKAAWEVIIPTIRSDNSRFLISFNPTFSYDWIYDNFVLNIHPDAEVVKLSISDNPYFPEVLRKEMEYDKKKHYNKYLHVWCGEIKINEDEALFKYDDINHVGEIDLDAFEKILISIDPSGSSHKGSDACGIMVIGKYAKINRYAVIEDQTAVMKSSEWGAKAVYLYNKYEANEIIYESNYGGEMVETVIKSIDKSIRAKPVRATKSKLLRAEPIQALYEQGLVDHFPGLNMLEGEMTSYTGDKGEKSPNRLDAMVWGITWFMKNRHAIIPNGMVEANMTNFRF